jgi:hypothetical protein
MLQWMNNLHWTLHSLSKAWKVWCSLLAIANEAIMAHAICIQYASYSYHAGVEGAEGEFDPDDMEDALVGGEDDIKRCFQEGAPCTLAMQHACPHIVLMYSCFLTVSLYCRAFIRQATQPCKPQK